MSIRTYNAVSSTYGTTNCDAANTVFARAETFVNCTANGTCPAVTVPDYMIGVGRKDNCVKDYASFVDGLFKYSPYGYLESGLCPSDASAFSDFHVLNVCTLVRSGTASELWVYYPQNRTLTQSAYADTACRVLTARNIHPLKDACDSSDDNIYRVFSVPLPSSSTSSLTTSAAASAAASSTQAASPAPAVEGGNKAMIIIGLSLGAVLLLILAFCVGIQRRKQKEALKWDRQISSAASATPAPEVPRPGTTTDQDRMRQTLPAVPRSTYHAQTMQSSLMSVYQTPESSAVRDRGAAVGSFAFEMDHPGEHKQESPPEYSAMPHSGVSTTRDMKL
ncbi:hypothetical protein HDU78_010931 [Chytriomyces hyalinus]|nr:hypothetical protein HDU78_010931 [Chytriomyces hyalinus]